MGSVPRMKIILGRPGISRRLREAREAQGLTRDEMARMLKMHVRSMDAYENPKVHTIPFEKMSEISEITGVSVSWILHGEEGPEHLMLQTLENVVQVMENLTQRVEALEQAVTASLASRPSRRSREDGKQG